MGSVARAHPLRHCRSPADVPGFKETLAGANRSCGRPGAGAAAAGGNAKVDKAADEPSAMLGLPMADRAAVQRLGEARRLIQRRGTPRRLHFWRPACVEFRLRVPSGSVDAGVSAAEGRPERMVGELPRKDWRSTDPVRRARTAAVNEAAASGDLEAMRK